MTTEQTINNATGQAVNVDPIVSAVLPCPFCGIILEVGGNMMSRDRKRSVKQVRHPVTDQCPLDMLVFRLNEWQHRQPCKTFCRLFAEAELTREYRVEECKLCKELKP